MGAGGSIWYFGTGLFALALYGLWRRRQARRRSRRRRVVQRLDVPTMDPGRLHKKYLRERGLDND